MCGKYNLRGNSGKLTMCKTFYDPLFYHFHTSPAQCRVFFVQFWIFPFWIERISKIFLKCLLQSLIFSRIFIGLVLHFFSSLIQIRRALNKSTLCNIQTYFEIFSIGKSTEFWVVKSHVFTLQLYFFIFLFTENKSIKQTTEIKLFVLTNQFLFSKYIQLVCSLFWGFFFFLTNWAFILENSTVNLLPKQL